jgi:hypothetical protein
MPESHYQDPSKALEIAIEQIDTFSKANFSNLEIGEDGRLIADKSHRLGGIVSLALSYIAPFFSDHRQDRKKKLQQIKEAILNAKGFIQSHSALIDSLQNGDESAKKLAANAMQVIHRYNTTIRQKKWIKKIEGYEIELPRAYSIKCESHLDLLPAHKSLKNLKESKEVVNLKPWSDLAPIHQKTMHDTFRIKANGLLQANLATSAYIKNGLSFIKQVEIELHTSGEGSFALNQTLSVGPGSTCFFDADFQILFANSRFVMPILKVFKFSFQSRHTGFPSPSQYSLVSPFHDCWIAAKPLRIDHTPLFQMIDQKKKEIADSHHDNDFIEKVRNHFTLIKEIFDENPEIFLGYHKKMEEVIREELSLPPRLSYSCFYDKILAAPSPFLLFNYLQEQLIDLFVYQPFAKLEEEWLIGSHPPLRQGSKQERLIAVQERLQALLNIQKNLFNLDHLFEAFLVDRGELLFAAYLPLGLLYFSEKIGLPVSALSSFTKKMQVCAFAQMIDFMHHYQTDHQFNRDELQQQLIARIHSQLDFLKSEGKSEREHFIQAQEIVEELNSNFTTNEKKN